MSHFATACLLTVFLSASLSAQAPASSETRARAALKAAEDALGDWQRCRQFEASFQADYDAKKAQLQNEHGRVPEALAELLIHKNKRVTRLHALCQNKHQAVNEKLQEAGGILDNSEPKSQAWIQMRVKELVALMKRFSQLSAPPKKAE